MAGRAGRQAPKLGKGAKPVIEVVFFDAMGTLMYLPQSVGHHYRTVAARHGLEAGEKELDAAFRSVWKQMPSRSATKAPRPDDDKGWWRDLVGRVFETIAPGRPLSRECFEDIYAHFARPGVWQLYPETPGVLAGLKKRCRLGVISNFDGRLRIILGQLGVLEMFEKVVISSEAGADKPSPHIFEHALTIMKVCPANALHVGDDPLHDWAAAAALGMPVYKLKRPENSLTGLLEFSTA